MGGLGGPDLAWLGHAWGHTRAWVHCSSEVARPRLAGGGGERKRKRERERKKERGRKERERERERERGEGGEKKRERKEVGGEMGFSGLFGLFRFKSPIYSIFGFL